MSNTKAKHAGNARRLEILQFITDYRNDHRFGPTTREIARGVQLASNSTAALHLDTLRADGLIAWSELGDGTMITRSIDVTPAGRRQVSQIRHQDGQQ